MSMKIPTQSIVKMVACAALLLLVLLLLIYPNSRTIDRLEGEIHQAETELHRQELLYPVYADLNGRITSGQEVTLPMPPQDQEGVAAVDAIPQFLTAKASRTGLKSLAISPDPRSLSSGNGLLLVNAVLEGEYVRFRDFLMELGGMPTLHKIEEIRIKEVYGAREFRLKVWFELDAAGSMHG
ncbi:MAG: hypothetical protein ACOC0U_08335 [Desulfovibrionales bacterium]